MLPGISITEQGSSALIGLQIEFAGLDLRVVAHVAVLGQERLHGFIESNLTLRALRFTHRSQQCQANQGSQYDQAAQQLSYSRHVFFIQSRSLTQSPVLRDEHDQQNRAKNVTIKISA